MHCGFTGSYELNYFMARHAESESDQVLVQPRMFNKWAGYGL